MGGFITAIRSQAYRAATRLYRNFRLSGRPRPGLRILMYHAIGTPIESDVRGLYNMGPKEFEVHMRHLAEKYAGNIVALDKAALKGDSLKFALTFDDGYRDNLLVAAPLLVELGIPFTVFVCSGAVAERKKGFLSPQEVHELGNLPGVTLGSHSLTHPRLTRCSNSMLHDELAGSKAYLEDLLGREVDTFSYPHGAVDRRVRDAAECVGYRIGACSRFDINQRERDPLLLCRTDIWAKDDLSVFEEKLQGDWDWNRWRSML